MAIAAPALTDEDIQQQAVNELTWDAEAKPVGDERTDLDIAAAAAHAQSWVEHPEAERVAWSTLGATEVENHITVRP